MGKEKPDPTQPIQDEILKWKPANKLHPLEREQFMRILGNLAYQLLNPREDVSD